MIVKRKHAPAPRQRKPRDFLLFATILLGACAQSQTETFGPPGFIGGVVADEPRAALVGRDILAAGGSAADAAVATYFALAATLPSRAGLGGGGMCLSYDVRFNQVEALDFVARAPAAGGPAAVPANVRGMYALYAKTGRLRWEQLLAPGEEMARFGAPVSRALANDLAAAADTLGQDPALRASYLRPDGTPLGEGDMLRQDDLSAALAAIRLRGPAEFHGGQFGRGFVRAAAQVGAGITEDEIRNVLPAWRPTVLVRHDGLTVHFPPPPAVAGVMEAQLFAMLAPRWGRVSADERPHLFAEAGLRASWDRERWLAPDLSTTVPIGDLVGAARLDAMMQTYRPDRRMPPDSLQPGLRQRPAAAPSASFVAVDRDGGAVSCEVTLNDMFGMARVAPGSGIVLAAAPDGAARGPHGLGMMIAVRSRAGRLMFAGAATGGAAASSALVDVALRTLVGERPLDESIDSARLHYSGVPDAIAVEEGGAGRLPGLTQRGYALTPVPSLGRVNAIYCPDGLVTRPQGCQFRADRRGFGLAARG